MSAPWFMCGLPKAVASTSMRWVRENERLLRVLRIPPQRSGLSPTLLALRREHATARIDGFPLGSPIDQLARTIAAERVGRGVHHLSLFLSPAGGATPAHYDATDVLVVQFRGSKTVVVANEPTVSDPPQDALLEDWCPAEALTFELERGDGLLIPRGHAHLTFSARMSMTLGIGLL